MVDVNTPPKFWLNLSGRNPLFNLQEQYSKKTVPLGEVGNIAFSFCHLISTTVTACLTGLLLTAYTLNPCLPPGLMLMA